jgi:8-amino-7-oxononanoate synthase
MCFSSNDYAGLARDPRVVAAAQAALAAHGAGASASRLMAGQLDIHAQLEAALAGFLGVEAALVFPSGYQANIGVLTALAGRDAAIYSDALNHASLIDGARLSRAVVHVYPHNDVGALEELLARDAGTGRKLIVTESVFSMDGDCAPVAALHDCAARHGAWLVVDEAHAIGVFGEGRGLCAARGAAPDVVLGTLSKALGSQGGFAACTRDVRDLLINMARTFIFSTGLAPACAGAALEAINILAAAPALAGEALERAAHFRAALRACGLEAPGEAHIVPIVLGSEAATMRAAEGCRARGVLAHGIRPPTVPPGACRLRLSVSRLHTDGQLSWAAAQIADAVREARA